MKPAAFEMSRPHTVDDALALLADNPDSKFLAGGQSLVPIMNLRLATPSLLVDLNRIPTLSGILRDGEMLRIGAMIRQLEPDRKPNCCAACALTGEGPSKYWSRPDARSRNNRRQFGPCGSVGRIAARDGDS